MGPQSMTEKSEQEKARAEREALRARHDAIPGGSEENDWELRKAWFESVYQNAKEDAAQIPWAELKPKDPFINWLAQNPGNARSAVDVGCGLGDNAEAMVQAGFQTTAFDVSAKAIHWAQKRFPHSAVTYRVEDLFNLPADMEKAYDVVYECYTIQALSPQMRPDIIKAITSLVKEQGTLLVLTRMAHPDDEIGIPWPLSEEDVQSICAHGLRIQNRIDYVNQKADGRLIPHLWLELVRER